MKDLCRGIEEGRRPSEDAATACCMGSHHQITELWGFSVMICILLHPGMGIDWLMDTRLARAPALWVGLFCFSVATFLGTLAHMARLKALKVLR